MKVIDNLFLLRQKSHTKWGLSDANDLVIVENQSHIEYVLLLLWPLLERKKLEREVKTILPAALSLKAFVLDLIMEGNLSRTL